MSLLVGCLIIRGLDLERNKARRVAPRDLTEFLKERSGPDSVDLIHRMIAMGLPDDVIWDEPPSNSDRE